MCPGVLKCLLYTVSHWSFLVSCVIVFPTGRAVGAQSHLLVLLFPTVRTVLDQGQAGMRDDVLERWNGVPFN